MRGIAIGDLHSGLVYRGISFNDRIDKCLKQVYFYTRARDISLLVFLGDIFHNMYYSVDALVFIINWLWKFDELGIRIFVIEGNHDKKKFGRDKKTMFDILDCFNFENISLVRSSVWFKRNSESKTFLLFIPYVDKSDVPNGKDVQLHLEEYIKEQLKELGKKHPRYKFIVFSHLSVKGAQAGSEIELISSADIQVPDCLLKESKVKKIINGHIHLSQEVGKVIMPGSIESFRFGEGNRRYFIEFEL